MPHTLRDIPLHSYTAASVRAMYDHVAAGIADPTTIAESRAVARRVPIKDDRAIAEALLADTKRRVRYVRDPIGVEPVAGLKWLRKVKSGDCDEQSIWLAAHAAAAGIPARFVTIKAKQPQIFDHVYTELYIEGHWLPADPAVLHSRIGWEAPKYFEKKVWHDPRLRTNEPSLGVIQHSRFNFSSDAEALGEGFWEQSLDAGKDSMEMAADYSPDDWSAGLHDLGAPPQGKGKRRFANQKGSAGQAVTELPPFVPITQRSGKAILARLTKRLKQSKAERAKFRRERKIALDNARAAMFTELLNARREQRDVIRKNLAIRMSALRSTWAKRRKELGDRLKKRTVYKNDAFILPKHIADKAGIGQSPTEVSLTTIAPYEKMVSVIVQADIGPDPDPSKETVVHPADIEAAGVEIAEAAGSDLAAVVAEEVKTGKIAVTEMGPRMKKLAKDVLKNVARRGTVTVVAESEMDVLIDEGFATPMPFIPVLDTGMNPRWSMPEQYAHSVPRGLGQLDLDTKTMLTWGVPLAVAALVLPRLLGKKKRRR